MPMVSSLLLAVALAAAMVAGGLCAAAPERRIGSHRLDADVTDLELAFEIAGSSSDRGQHIAK